jgi:tricorn protease-like protein
VAYQSYASNLVADDTNGYQDVFVFDRETGETSRVSVTSEGNEGNSTSERPSISGDGRFVAFQSSAFLVPEDENDELWYFDYEIYVHDRETGETTRITTDYGLVYVPEAGEYLLENGIFTYPSISADGCYVAYMSSANYVVLDDTNWAYDVFLYDRDTGETSRVSVDSEGNEANSSSTHPAISPDGRYVFFASSASNLIQDDTNGYTDVFSHNLQTGETLRVSVDSQGGEANNASGSPSASGDGGYVAFISLATNLVPEDTYSVNYDTEIYVHGPLSNEPQTLSVEIEIAPRRDPNRINPATGRPAVALLATGDFDVTQVDPTSVRFGPALAVPMNQRMLDVDSDGDKDWVFYFLTTETGIACGDTEASLIGRTFSDMAFAGTDSIITVGCQ